MCVFVCVCLSVQCSSNQAVTSLLFDLLSNELSERCAWQQTEAKLGQNAGSVEHFEETRHKTIHSRFTSNNEL